MPVAKEGMGGSGGGLKRTGPSKCSCPVITGCGQKQGPKCLFPVLVSWVMGSHGPEVMAHASPPALAKEGDRVQGPVTEGKCLLGFITPLTNGLCPQVPVKY